jgi:hypothetical protein
MRLIDLTRTLDPTAVDRMPEVVRPLAAILAPKIQYLAPESEGRDRMCAIFGCTPDDLPDARGEKSMTLNSTAARVDTPSATSCCGARSDHHRSPSGPALLRWDGSRS